MRILRRKPKVEAREVAESLLRLALEPVETCTPEMTLMPACDRDVLERELLMLKLCAIDLVLTRVRIPGLDRDHALVVDHWFVYRCRRWVSARGLDEAKFLADWEERGPAYSAALDSFMKRGAEMRASGRSDTPAFAIGRALCHFCGVEPLNIVDLHMIDVVWAETHSRTAKGMRACRVICSESEIQTTRTSLGGP